MVRKFVQIYKKNPIKYITIFEKGAEEIKSEVKTQGLFFDWLFQVRKQYPIQDALLLPEFKDKSAQFRQKVGPRKTLYCHVIPKPNLYLTTSKLNKVLFVQGVDGKPEYR